jgi:hypothetical protein
MTEPIREVITTDRPHRTSAPFRIKAADITADSLSKSLAKVPAGSRISEIRVGIDSGDEFLGTLEMSFKASSVVLMDNATIGCTVSGAKAASLYHGVTIDQEILAMFTLGAAAPTVGEIVGEVVWRQDVDKAF